MAIGVVTGVVSAMRGRGALDRALRVGSAMALSVPVYWFGFAPARAVRGAVGLPRADPVPSWYGGYVPFGDDPWRWLQAMWVPWLVIAAPLAAMCHRMTRSSLAETITEDFVRIARAKGLREGAVVGRHALRAALPPVIGLVSVNVALLVRNVILVEPAFNLPGFFRRADIGRFRGEQSHVPGLDIIQGTGHRGIGSDRRDDAAHRPPAGAAGPAVGRAVIAARELPARAPWAGRHARRFARFA